MGSKPMATLILLMVLVTTALPSALACNYCSPPISTRPPYPKRPPKDYPPYTKPSPVIGPPVVVNPPPAYTYPPYTGGAPPSSGGLTPPIGGSGGLPGINPPPSSDGKCSVDLLKLGLCLDVLGGLVHVGLGNPVENMCCPVLQGLLELEAAVCLCTAIRIKVLNLNIYIPLALQVLVTCGKDPPPGYLCPAL